MRMDKLTSRFQQALADAQSLAAGRDHSVIEPAHLLVALLDQSGGSTRPMLAQAGVNVPLLRGLLGLQLLSANSLWYVLVPAAAMLVLGQLLGFVVGRIWPRLSRAW